MLRVIYLTEEDATRIAVLLRLSGGPKGSLLADKIMASEQVEARAENTGCYETRNHGLDISARGNEHKHE